MKEVELRYVGGHVEVYTEAGAFLFSADTLREARVEVKEIPGKPGSYNAVAHLQPWLQMEELTTSMRMVARIPQKIGFEPGSLVPLRGVPHRVVHEPTGRGATRLGQGEEPAIIVHGDVASVPGRVRRFLAAEASRDLAASVLRHTADLGIPARKVTLRDTRSRWGSCSSTGALSFSWRLIMAPPLVLDYLAAHEVAHLKEMNHSPRFWAVTRALCPRTDEAEAWLKRHGAGLHRYG